MRNLFGNGKTPAPRPPLRQVWAQLNALQRALIVLVLLSAALCFVVASIGVVLGIWTGS